MLSGSPFPIPRTGLARRVHFYEEGVFVFQAVTRAEEGSPIVIAPALAGLAALIVRILRNAAHARV